MGNTLYYGDNLEILRKYISENSVDLIYLDPPFNSKADYNILYRELDGEQSSAQITAFEDTWHWTEETQSAFQEVIEIAPVHVVEMIQALKSFIGMNDMMAYLTMMCIRLIELRRVLKETGSIYLHCDPTASHYLKILMDAIFGAKNFRNEIIWQRTTAKALMKKRLPTNHDVLLSYQKGEKAKWNDASIYTPYDLSNLDEKTASKYTLRDVDGRLYQLTDITNPNPDRPNLTYEFLGITKVWRWTKERMEAAYNAGLVIQPRPGAVPRLKRYLDEQRGKPLGDVWTDIPPINSQAAERLGYPTQKPETLLERIINFASEEGDVVLDPFCGCGTTISAAQKLKRNWIGIDITHLAINLIKWRLKERFGLEQKIDYRVTCEPEDLGGAKDLALLNRYQFQWWALSLIDARPFGDKKKGADSGIDGVIYFNDEKNKFKKAIIQVKSGSVSVKDIRDLGHVIDREKAEIGIFLTLETPTRNMSTEAIVKGSYRSPTWNQDYPRMQILTIEDLLSGKRPRIPATIPSHKKAKSVGQEQESFEY